MPRATMPRCGSATASSTARAKAVIARLKNAAADGLDPADYPVPDFGALTGAEALADGDIKLTNSVLTFARHLAIGRIAPTRVSAEVDYGNHTPEPADILQASSPTPATPTPRSTASIRRMHGFKALKAKLAELRAQRQRRSPTTAFADGAGDQAGRRRMRACRSLRERLGVAGKPDDTHLRQGAVQRRSRTCRRAPTSSRPA